MMLFLRALPCPPPLPPHVPLKSSPLVCMQVTSSLHIMGKPHIEHSGIMKINNLQSSLAAKIKFEASSRLSWGESHQVLYHIFPIFILAHRLNLSYISSPPPAPLTSQNVGKLGLTLRLSYSCPFSVCFCALNSSIASTCHAHPLKLDCHAAYCTPAHMPLPRPLHCTCHILCYCLLLAPTLLLPRLQSPPLTLLSAHYRCQVSS